MRISDKAVVLQAIKFGDKKLILKLYTKQNGLLTVSAFVGRGSSSKLKSSTLLPLTLIDIEFLFKQNKDIHQLTEASCNNVFKGISKNLSKLTIAQFINEILIKTLKEQSSNFHLFEFIETCLKFLDDAQENYINLHIYFLIELTKYIGFEPKNNYSVRTPYFDCREGQFTFNSLSLPLGLSKDDSVLFSEFLKINSLKTNLSNFQRQHLLEILLAYYRLHIPGFNDIKSLEVLKEVLAL